MWTKRILYRALAAGLLLALLHGSAQAEDPLAEAMDKVQARMVRELEDVIDWARGRKINGFRHRMYALILELDADHKRARKVLGYRRKSKDEPWVPSGKYRTPSDFDKGMLAKAEVRVHEALAHHRDAVLALLDTHPDASSATRAELLERLIDVVPDDAKLRSSLGHVEHDGRWVLVETVDGEKFRADFRARVAEARARIGPGIRKDTGSLARGWHMALRNDERRVFGNVDASAGRSTLLNSEIAAIVCAPSIGLEACPFPFTDVVLLSDSAVARKFFESRRATRALAEMDELGSMFLDTGEYVIYYEAAERGAADAVSQVINWGITSKFSDHPRAWLDNGAVERLTWLITGRHTAGFLSLENTERLRDLSPDDPTLPEDPLAWPRAAAELLERDGGRRLIAVLTVRINAMKAADVLVAYGLSAYALEARPELFQDLIRKSIASDDAAAVLEEVFGADPASIAWRIRRWLLELR